MARPNYQVQDNPDYNPEIPAILDTDPVRASSSVNLVFERIINNIHAAKQIADAAKSTADAAKDAAASAGKRPVTLIVGATQSGHTAAEVDFLCTGTDDHVQINAAIAALPASGGKIVIREGTYNIAAQITLNRANVTIEGMGSSTVLLRQFAGNVINVSQSSRISELGSS